MEEHQHDCKVASRLRELVMDQKKQSVLLHLNSMEHESDIPCMMKDVHPEWMMNQGSDLHVVVQTCTSQMLAQHKKVLLNR